MQHINSTGLSGSSNRWCARVLAGIASLTLVAGLANAETPPATIRIGAPAISGTTQAVMGIPGIARVKGWLDEEFAADGTHFEFPGFKGGAVAVSQVLANQQIDFAYSGDLISIIGHAAGIPTRMILPCGKFENAYLAVRPDSDIQGIESLRGKKVAYTKGGYIHLQVIRILAAHGLEERDIQAINLDYPTAAAALASGDIDAAFGGLETLSLRDRGIARIAYDTRGQDDTLTGQAGILVHESFAKRYPQTTARLVKVWVKVARWASDPANADEVLRIWATGNRTVELMRENYSDRPLKERLSPLLDPFLTAQYQDTQALAQKLGLLRGQPFAIDAWFDRSYLDQALQQLNLEGYWQPLPAHDSGALKAAQNTRNLSEKPMDYRND
ncbi:ABC transporter substrate-binding protein [Pseudomonas sp. D5002]|uniref:ABC transporter substrate-binding protein n=1 Tax=Pseudomonas sp. D5002 TaxID=2738818 RepID=UPI0015A48559|nr:ABC transporter substrate-binding protein [Pseudomonas sp. D5002]NWB09098.1 ABC transporter substrate-binding protein [Pseudomonas sp. D5002]